MDDNTSNMGVVDPSILNVDNDDGIPTFLQRNPPPVNMSEFPVFGTAEAPNGQVELTVEDGEADTSIDIPSGEDVLAQLAPQTQETVSYDEQLQAGVTQEGNDEVHSPNEHITDDETPPAIGHNQPADPAEMRRDFFKDVNKFGKASGEGASALGRLGLRALRAAADGVLSTQKPAGGGKDDATLVYEAYTAMDSKHAEHTPGGAKANASKLRQIIGMGCMTTLSDPVAIGDKVVRIREEMEGADLKPKALFAALVDVARDQQASDTELSDAAIRAALTKTKADKTLEKEWEAINKRVEGLITGEASHGLKDQSEAALKISQLIGEHVKNYKADGKRQDMIENMMEHGYSRAQSEAIVDKKIAL